MQHIQVIFTGIVLLLAPGRVSEHVTAVLVNAGQASVASDGSAIPAHYAWLRFPLDAIDRTSTATVDHRVTIDGQQYGVVLLKGVNVSFPNADDSDLILEDGVPGTLTSATADNGHFLWWVSHIGDLWAGSHMLRDGVIAPHADAQLLSARVTLNRGKLATETLTEENVSFTTPMKTSPHPIAHAVGLTVTATRRRFAIRLEPFDGNTRERSLILTLPKNGDTLRLTIANTTVEDMEGGPYHVHNGPDRHYELYYRLFADAPIEMPVPIFSPSSTFSARRFQVRPLSSHSDCPPAWF